MLYDGLYEKFKVFGYHNHNLTTIREGHKAVFGKYPTENDYDEYMQISMNV